MKKNEIAILILVISISVVVAYLIGKAIIGEPKNQSVQVEAVEAITTTVTEPNYRVFNAEAINPTVPIQIGDPSNQQPFTGN